jgi:hypothetical protein
LLGYGEADLQVLSRCLETTLIDAYSAAARVDRRNSLQITQWLGDGQSLVEQLCCSLVVPVLTVVDGWPTEVIGKVLA